MRTRIWLINAALLFVVVFASANTYRTWTQPPTWQPDTTSVKTQPSKAARVVSNRLPAESSFKVVTERNLFNESRQTIILPVTTDTAEEDQSEAKTAALIPEETSVKVNNRTILLYGVAMAGDIKKALITNPFFKGHERKEMWITTGETLDDYQVLQIEPRRVLLRKAGKVYQISLSEKRKPRDSSMATSSPQKATPAVVHTGSSNTGTEKTPKGNIAGQAPPASGDINMTPFGPVGGNKK